MNNDVKEGMYFCKACVLFKRRYFVQYSVYMYYLSGEPRSVDKYFPDIIMTVFSTKYSAKCTGNKSEAA